MKKLPIGIQTFSKIVDGNLAYVDKTKIAYKLITGDEYYFLSRPRRFGKSLFVDTLKEIFEGNKRLFKGLYIEDKWDFEDKYPVLRISFGAGVNKNIEELHRSVRWILGRSERELKLKCDDSLNTKECFENLIWQAYEKHNKKVVILIDEYDKPILDNITNPQIATVMRDEMKNFYSVIKDNDKYIRFVFITGVSKFSKMNLFSGLNNLQDITLNANYGEICGYTHHDLLTVFDEHLRGVDMEEVRSWYNGYNYFGAHVYNPFDILLFIANNKEFRNYWWSTGNPSFLIDLIRKKNYYLPDVENYEATDAILDSFDVDTIELEPLLWQTGYLTIKEKKQDVFGMKYKLGVPNREVQTSLNRFFITLFTTQTGEQFRYQSKMVDIFRNENLEELEDTIHALFASIPYHNFTNNKIADYEGYYASVIYAYLVSLGLEIIVEDAGNRGRIDMTLKMDDKVFIFEFKTVITPTGNALQQIKEKKYYEKYRQTARKIYLIGMEFGKKERNILRFEWEELGK